jgi:hypothetical protein
MQGAASQTVFRHRHLLGIEGLSPEDINYVLDLADGYVELNRQPRRSAHCCAAARSPLLFREFDAEIEPLEPKMYDIFALPAALSYSTTRPSRPSASKTTSGFPHAPRSATQRSRA